MQKKTTCLATDGSFIPGFYYLPPLVGVVVVLVGLVAGVVVGVFVGLLLSVPPVFGFVPSVPGLMTLPCGVSHGLAGRLFPVPKVGMVFDCRQIVQ